MEGFYERILFKVTVSGEETLNNEINDQVALVSRTATDALRLVGSDMITVHLPFLYAILLIAISVIVTVIGGIIPAAKASRKDPVIALRSE